MRARMLSLTGMLFAALIAAAGCQSTSQKGNASLAAGPTPAAEDVAWKRAPSVSTALAQDNWKDPVRTTVFQEGEPPKGAFPPVPDLLIKDDSAHAVTAQPASFKHFGHHSTVAPALPNAPTEWSPVTLPSYVVRPPDVLLIELLPQFSRDENLKLKANNIGLLNQPIFGQHLVRPDGTVELGIYGPVLVAGRTLQEARTEIAKLIHARLDQKKATLEDVVNNLKVDVLTYNSSVYYVITDGAGLGQQVYRFPVTGHETVLDAIANINGLPVVACPKKIWVSRKNVGQAGLDGRLPVDWKGITQDGAADTNWQLMPGDRVFVQSDPMRRFNNSLGKMLEPIERLFGATLLGGQTVNTIKNGTTVIH